MLEIELAIRDACDERRKYFERRKALNWCYGKVGQVHARDDLACVVANSLG